MRTGAALVVVVLGMLCLPSAASAGGISGRWNLGPLLDVQISVSNGKYIARARNRVSACGVAKDEIVWRFDRGPNARGGFGTSEVFTFPGGVCYGRTPAVQASFLLRPDTDNVLRVCGSNGLRSGVPPKTDFSSPKATYPCADYRRIIRKTALPFTPSGTLAYFQSAVRYPGKRCPSTGPTTYRINFREQPQDPMLRFESFTVNGVAPEIYEGSPQRGYVQVDTPIKGKAVVLFLRFRTEASIRGIRVAWKPCVFG